MSPPPVPHFVEVALYAMLVVFAVLSLGISLPPAARARQPTRFERRELTIPMRDGTRLFAVALVPTPRSGPLPILLIRTPFSAAGTFSDAELPAPYRELARDGYIFVAQDIRGRFGSEGEFVVLRAQDDPRSPQGINESTDAYDTIDWLVRHLPGNNGKVGVLGMSYAGWLAGLAGVDPHPAVRAISPQAPTADTWLGDDFFHQGAFRQSQGVEFAAFAEVNPKGFNFLAIPTYDHYEYYARFPTLDSLARAAGVSGLPLWRSFVEHPEYDAYWQARAMQRVLTRPEVPTLFVGGFWDAEDLLGPQVAYRTLERADTGRRNRIALGPWFHNGWAQPIGDSLGPIPLGSNTGDWFREQVQRPWFAWYLHGKGDGRFPEAWVFETGGNRWRTFDRWPPPEATPRRLYLREHRRLSFDPPSSRPGDSTAFDAYVSDPAHPIPYLPRPDDGTGWRTWLLRDQRFVDGRPDVLTWTSEPLEDDLVIAGDVTARLHASTTGTDADWVVKLIDVYPDSVSDRPRLGGYQLMVNADILRGRYRRGFERPAPIPPDRVLPFTVDLHQQLYRFRKGHRIMVQVQSTWFPLYDRNPQTFVPNIFRARAADYRAREHRIWHARAFPSYLTLPVLP